MHPTVCQPIQTLDIQGITHFFNVLIGFPLNVQVSNFLFSFAFVFLKSEAVV